ncbi:Metallo-hydrolase/oxidoreductase [Obba rivulosa]|uniref:Metallo-hydrolase/oxidoreductase n=1 Tax=Obba rivulosa TaxID=1052685 RepID=A0A8E2B203_9APHY|nr:Metallo-hydrolase/oxidoreductase [Obba rivulosa]
MIDNTRTLMLPKPSPNQAYVNVSALEAGFIQLPPAWYVQGADPSEIRIVPSLAFYLQHSVSKECVVFDLGVRRDTRSYPPAIRSLIAQAMPVNVPQTIEESLSKGGIKHEDVRTIILSHLHFDHSIGDAVSFPNATFVLGKDSEELLRNGYPANPHSDFLQSSVPIERTRFLTGGDFNIAIGPFPRAHDYFGDGSLYIVDAAGHCKGHINVLARTSTAGSWIYLGGDSAHDVRILTGEKDVATYTTSDGKTRCRHMDRERAIEHIRRVGALLKMPSVHVLIAHDWEWYKRHKHTEFFPGYIRAKL